MYTTLPAIDILFAAVFLFYGIYYLVKPPKYKGSNALNTAYTRKNEAAWKYGHHVGGWLFLGSGLFLAFLCILKRLLIGPECSAWIRHGYTALEFILVIVCIAVTNHRVKKKFGFED